MNPAPRCPTVRSIARIQAEARQRAVAAHAAAARLELMAAVLREQKIEAAAKRGVAELKRELRMCP